MATFNDGPQKSFPASAAITDALRVKLTAGQLALAGVGAADEPVEIGTTYEPSFAAGENQPVRLRGGGKTTRMTASKAIAQGVAVYGAANGQISDAASGNARGVSLEAATAAGDIIDVLER